MTTRRPLLAGNWKMHCTASEAARLAEALLASVGDVTDRDILVAPPFPALGTVKEVLRGTRILIGAQNLHWEESGAYTGEVSAPMLADVGCTHVIIGHSERRQYFGDTDDWVARKIRTALRHRLAPIVCVGESLPEREASKTLAVVERQVRTALEGLDREALHPVVIAYEPIWAIGTGKVATPTEAREVHSSIRRLLVKLAGETVAADARILYGGSVTPDNVDVLMQQPDIDGALVGGASLTAQDFTRIVRFES